MAAGGEHLRTKIPGKEGDVPDYARVQGIFIGVVAVLTGDGVVDLDLGLSGPREDVGL